MERIYTFVSLILFASAIGMLLGGAGRTLEEVGAFYYWQLAALGTVVGLIALRRRLHRGRALSDRDMWGIPLILIMVFFGGPVVMGVMLVDVTIPAWLGNAVTFFAFIGASSIGLDGESPGKVDRG